MTAMLLRFLVPPSPRLPFPSGPCCSVLVLDCTRALPVLPALRASALDEALAASHFSSQHTADPAPKRQLLWGSTARHAAAKVLDITRRKIRQVDVRHRESPPE